MKRLFTSLVLILLTINFFAQAPQKMSYQTIIRNSSGQLVTKQTVGMRISILKDSTTGDAVYVETQMPTTNANGLATIEIGDGTVGNGTFAEIDWSTGLYYLKTETDPEGGINYTIIGTSQLLSMPYAFYSTKSGNGFSGDYKDLTNKPALWDSTYNSIKNKPDLTIFATKDMGSQTITNIANPINGQDAATKAYVDDIILELQSEVGVTDIDGNHYKSVKIGNQVWMAENLKTTKFKDGKIIEGLEVFPQFNYKAQMWWYNDNEAAFKNIYGALYNWHAVYTGNLCPKGWHVPTDAEWTTLTDYLGGIKTAGGKLKEEGTAHWNSPNTGSTNQSGFTALPGGYRYYGNKNFYNIGEFGNWWSSTQDNWINALYRKLNYNDSIVEPRSENKGDGFSVRCISDYIINYKVHYVGETFGGGTVFYVHDNGQHGLMILSNEFPPIFSVKWRDALKECANYSVTVGGVTYDDWYLPSMDELLLLCSQNIVSGTFWTSSEGTEPGTAIIVSLQVGNYKYCDAVRMDTIYLHDVRPVRAF